MASRKVTDEQILGALGQGLNFAAMGRMFQVDESTLRKRVRRLQAGGLVPAGTPAPSGELPVIPEAGQVDRHLDTLGQLVLINRDALKLLRRAMTQGKTDPATAGKMMSEIRSQLGFALKVYQELYSIQQVAEFQRAVLAEIEAEAPEVQARIISRLKEWRARRQAARA